MHCLVRTYKYVLFSYMPCDPSLLQYLHTRLSPLHNALTLVIEVLVEGVQPVDQLFSGVCGEEDGLSSSWRRVADGQAVGSPSCRVLVHHTDARVLEKERRKLDM